MVQVRVQVRLLETPRVLAQKNTSTRLPTPPTTRFELEQKKTPRSTAISEGGEGTYISYKYQRTWPSLLGGSLADHLTGESLIFEYTYTLYGASSLILASIRKSEGEGKVRRVTGREVKAGAAGGRTHTAGRSASNSLRAASDAA